MLKHGYKHDFQQQKKAFQTLYKIFQKIVPFKLLF